MGLKRVNWLDHTIQMAVVFLSIMLAFMLNNWNDGRRDRQKENEYLSSFIADLEADSTELALAIAANGKLLRRIDSLEQVILRKDWGHDSLFHYNNALSQLNAPSLNSSTYESSKFSGNFGLIRDFDLRRHIISYYQMFEARKTVESIQQSFAYDYVLDLYMRSPADWSKSPIATLSGSEYINVVRGVRVTLAQSIAHYQQMLHSAGRLTGEIREELKDASG